MSLTGTVSIRTRLAIALLLPSLLASCADHADSVVRLKLRLHVESSAGLPEPAVAVWLKDYHPGLREQPKALQKPVCVTSAAGECEANLRYGFGYSAWPWLQRLRRRLSRGERFEVLVLKENVSLARQFLPELTGSQITGFEEVRIDVRLPPLEE